jgi:hypothetical protein
VAEVRVECVKNARPLAYYSAHNRILCLPRARLTKISRFDMYSEGFGPSWRAWKLFSIECVIPGGEVLGVENAHDKEAVICES